MKTVDLEVIEFGYIKARSVNKFLCFLKYLAVDPDPITSTICLEAGSALVRNNSWYRMFIIFTSLLALVSVVDNNILV
jgi:hypothetical protein